MHLVSTCNFVWLCNTEDQRPEASYLIKKKKGLVAQLQRGLQKHPGIKLLHLPSPIAVSKESLFPPPSVPQAVVVVPLFVLRYLRFLVLPSLSGIRDSALPNFCLVNTRSVLLLPTVSTCPQPSEQPLVAMGSGVYPQVRSRFQSVCLFRIWNAPTSQLASLF